MFLYKNLLKPLATGLLACSAFASLQCHADETYGYLVSVQDMNGIHLCNGSYIGNKQIVFSPDCKLSDYPEDIGPILPPGGGIIITPSDPNLPPFDSGLENGDLLLNGAPISLATTDKSKETQKNVIINGVEISPLDSSSIGLPISFPWVISGPNYPSLVTFVLDDGSVSDSIRITSFKTHPYTGKGVLATIDWAPETAEALKLANDEQINQLQNNDSVNVKMVGHYLSIDSSSIGELPLLLNNPEKCSGISTDLFARELCLSMTPYERPECPEGIACLLPSQPSALSCTDRDEAKGAPIIASMEDGKKILLGFKQVNFRNPIFGFTDCNIQSSVSQFFHWINLEHAKSQGLSIATAYDLGERPLIERTKFDIEITNTSDEKIFNITDTAFVMTDKFKITNANCSSLAPSESCSISVYAKINAAIRYNGILSLTINGKEAGTHIAAKGKSHTFIKGDRDSAWSMDGWIKTRHGFGGDVKANYNLERSPTLKRKRHLVDPKSMSITYRAEGDQEWIMNANITRKGLKYSNLITGLDSHRLNGTNGQWVTETFNVNEPGTYEVTIGKGPISVVHEDPSFNIEISDICFNDCN